MCELGKNGFYSGAIAVGEKRPKYRTVLSSEYSMDKWAFIAKEQDGDRSGQLLVPCGTIVITRGGGPNELACSPEERAEGRGEAREDSKGEERGE